MKARTGKIAAGSSQETNRIIFFSILFFHYFIIAKLVAYGMEDSAMRLVYLYREDSKQYARISNIFISGV